MQITLERQSKAIALSFNTDNSIAYDELYLAVQDKMSAIVNGGKFFVGKAFTIVGNAVSVLSKNIYVQAAAGGLGSKLAGGSFELGFLTAGLAFAVNQVVTQLAQEKSAELKYNKPPPATVPPTGETLEALQCTADCLGLDEVLVIGGSETAGHSQNSLHSQNRAVDIAGPRFNNVDTETVLDCASQCGFTHGHFERFLNQPNRDHWHLQIGPENYRNPDAHRLK